jgi:hypothetical protein
MDQVILLWMKLMDLYAQAPENPLFLLCCVLKLLM